jgi:hypothetical protein
MLPDVLAMKWGLTLLLLLACNQLPKKPAGKGSSKYGKGGKGSPKSPKLPKVGDKFA